MTMKIGDNKTVERKFMNGFVLNIGIMTNKAGGVRIPIGRNRLIKSFPGKNKMMVVLGIIVFGNFENRMKIAAKG